MKTIILESGRCSHAKCIFCGYSKNERPVNTKLLKARLDQILADVEDKELKIFSSGSFLDRAQFPEEFVDYFAAKLKRLGINQLTIESRPEFVTEKALKVFEGIELTVAIGLETADEEESKTIAKGFTQKEFAKAADLIHGQGGKVRAYLLANIPFVKDIKKSIRSSVDFAKKHSDSIVVLNLLPHYKTPLMKLWLEGKWKPLSKSEFQELVKGINNIELDAETFRFTPQFPEKKAFDGVGVEYVTNQVYDTWQNYISDFYETPESKDIALFLPCAAKKPYKFSKTHTLIWKAIKQFRNVHRIVVSSPGVIPFEFNGFYPFNAYDWDESKETPDIMREYVRINRERLVRYLKKHKYRHYVCYFKPAAESYKALREACDELGIELTEVLVDKPTQEESLAKLKETLSGLE